MKIIPLILALTTSIAFSQGPLSPPGLPEPTMKTLAQIEPRTPITSLPHTITAPGSYYFTGNLQFTENFGSAIIISASDVTLDLGGFTLSSIPSVLGAAISVGSGLNGVSVKNGNITGSTTVLITGSPPTQTWTPTFGGFQYGIDDSSTGARFQNLSIRGCRNTGLNSYAGGKSIVENVNSTSNGTSGIFDDFGSVSNCTASSNGATGIVASSGSVTACTATSNGGSGIYAENGSVTSSSALYNGDNGIEASGGSVSNSSATANYATGIYGDSVTNSTARQNGAIGIVATSVTSSSAIYNGAYGIQASGGSVINSTASQNLNHGILASAGSVTNCTAKNNGQFGIFAGGGSVTNSRATSNFRIGIWVGIGVAAHCVAEGNSTNPATVDMEIDVTIGGQRDACVPAAE